MKHFIYSDPHFNHFNIIEYANRPFTTVEEMNEYMIEQFNKVVSPEDKVYILGDFGFGTKEQVQEIVSSLNGYKILIMGNHDRKRRREWWLEVGFDEVHKDPIILRKRFILSHEPMLMSEDMPYLNIHGHIHDKNLEEFGEREGRFFNACVEKRNYKPVLLEKLQMLIR